MNVANPSPLVPGMTQAERNPCLFSVHGNSREMRRKRIESVAEHEPCLGFLAAVFDFEWMARRAILALSNSPTAMIRVWFADRHKHGIAAYANGWKEFVRTSRKMAGLPFLLRHEVPEKPVEWSSLKDAFEQRHPLVHGFKGFIEDKVAVFNMTMFLDASDVIETILRNNGCSAFDTIKNRKSKTEEDESARKIVANSLKRSNELHSRVMKRVAKSKLEHDK